MIDTPKMHCAHRITPSLVVMFALCCWTVSTLDCPCECSDSTKYFYPLPRKTYFLVNCRNHDPLLTAVPRDSLPANTQAMELNYNMIKNVSRQDFQTLPELVYLDLSYNEIQQLYAYTFVNNTKLQALLLGGNQLTHIHDSAFDGLQQLKDLVLTQNALKSMPAAVQNLPSLVSIHLYRNEIPSLPSGAFLGTNNLQFINLHDNKIASIAPDALQDMSQLNNIYLTANLLETLPDTLFRDCTGIQYIALGNNQLVSVSADVFANLQKLRHLDLRQNFLQTLPSGIFHGVPDLFELHLEQNDIQDLPGDVFQGLSELNNLQLADNPIGALSEDIFTSCGKLTTLVMSHVTEIASKTFQPLKSLVTLDIQNSQISTINSDMFRGLESLQHLSLKGNQIKTILRNAFVELKKLNNLLLARNEIQFLQTGTFNNLSALQTLDLESNQLGHLDNSVFHGLYTLTKLSLHYNALTGVSSELLRDLKSLTALFLHHNKIHTIEQGSFEGLVNLVEFDVSSNPLYCDCRLRWYRDWMSRHDFKFSPSSLASTKCSQPKVYRERSLSSLSTDNFRCVFPSVTTERANVQVDYGDNVTMGCGLKNDSIADLVWTLPDLSQIHRGEVYPGISVDDVGTLTINNMTSFDTGVYICTSTNNIGSMNLTINVTVNLPTRRSPTTTVTTWSTSTMLTESVTTKSHKTKSPRRNHCKPNPCRNGGQCIFDDVKNQRLCICTLLYGGPTCEVTIPSPPTDVRIVASTGTSAVVSWSRLPDSQQVTSYQITVTSLDSWGKSQSPQVGGELDTYKLRFLMPNTSYNVCVIAVNDAGPSALDGDQCLVLVTQPLAAALTKVKTVPIAVSVAVSLVVVVTLLAVGLFCFCKRRKHRMGQYNKYSDHHNDGDGSFFSDQVKFHNCEDAALDLSMSQLGPTGGGETDTDTESLPGNGDTNHVTSIPSF